MDMLEYLIFGWIGVVIMIWLLLKWKRPQMFSTPTPPKKCSKCGSSELLPKFSKAQKAIPDWSGRWTLSGPVAFVCKKCGNEMETSRWQGIFTTGDLNEPHV